MKVFVLISEWSLDCEQEHRVWVYSNVDSAKNQMKSDYENFIREFNEFGEKQINEMSAYAYIDGDYAENHCTWTISEEEVSD